MYSIALAYESYVSKAIAFVGLCIALFAFTYAFLLLEAVGHTASRSESEAEVRSILSELGTLESRYLTQTKEVTPQLAAQMGFVVPEKTSVVFAKERDTLSLNAGL